MQKLSKQKIMASLTSLRAGRLLFALISAAFLLTGSLPAMAQDKTIQGRLTTESGSPIAGASVTIKGTSTGTTTNIKGEYTISAPKGAILVFSNVGFSEKEATVGDGNTINLQLGTATQSFDEVVVVGYGTRRKKDLTGSVASVNLEAQQNAPNTNLGQYLQGTVPGLNVGLSTYAGGTPPISIRGQNTLSGNQNVLIILDGIQYTGSLSSINPDDIASIDVLKDASSTAVYGAQAANGVLLITTRKGRAGTKPRIAFSSSYSTQRPTVDMRPMNREEYLKNIADAWYNEAYLAPDYTQPNPNFNVANRVDATMKVNGQILPNDFNWYDAATNTGQIFENNLSISGGNDRTTYLISGGLVDQKGFVINDIFKRKTIRANIETKALPWWKVGLISSGSFVNQDGAEPSLNSILRWSPLQTPYDANGKVVPFPTNTLEPNPFTTYYVDDYERHNYLFANVYSDIDLPFLKGLNYRMNFGNNYRSDQKFFSSIYGANQTGEASKGYADYYDYTFDNIVTYTNTFGKHNISATVLYGAIERKYNSTYTRATGFDRLSLSYNNLSLGTTITDTSDAWRERLNYQMARVNYKFNDKYLLTATLRRDGFSGFAENFKSAYFPTVAAGWIISSEDFMKDASFINYLKLRAGYGISGNQTPRFLSIARVTVSPSYIFGDGSPSAVGQQVSGLGNPDLKWERTRGFNAGIDFTLLDNRLSGNIDAYFNKTTDLLYSINIPEITGFTSIQTNVGELRNNGIEASITYKVIDKKDFHWSATANLWSNKNKIVTITGQDLNKDGVEDDLISSGLFIGKSRNAIYHYQTDGIYQIGDTRIAGFPVGSVRLVDQNKDNDITPDKDRVFLGRKEPAYQISLFNSFSYKDLSLSIFFNAIQGGKDGYLGNNNPSYFRDDNAIRNNFPARTNFWSPGNPSGKYPRNISGSRAKIEPEMYQKRSFIRLQDVSLSYNLNKFVKKAKFQALNVFVSGKNLVTWTDWEGWDPEALDLNNNPMGLITAGRPVMRAFTVGVNITY
ncbi:SusC/RagA family TonB-linked outer membrane protein [Niastella sp. OAS944]|uniref:SusC/RagA family TonB-linked outer membrane protein n=1 Tax=Niastella sp. OAS944 TaxID=2664089 RepID=UPI0035C87DE5|nr:TonB-linked SusC/RagA family outer membrane protein [Chitinophagaceae bacterium OAS944]